MGIKEKHLAFQLAKFCNELGFDAIPEPVVEKVKQCILDIIGICIAGSQMPWSKQVVEYVRQTAGRPESLVIGHSFRTDVCNAAFANGTFGHSIEMDEQHNPSITHPSPVLMAAALSIGEKEAANGYDFIVAIVAGYEIMTRIGMAVAPSILVDRGFHPTSVNGPLGAAVVAGRLLKLNDTQMLHAISIAAMHSSGLLEYLYSGGEYKRAHPGMAAHNGVRSALLAKLGLTGPPSILEGPKGFLNAFSTKPNPHPILEGLGKEFQVLKVAFKPYACCRLIHSAIDAVKILKQKYGFKTGSIEKINIYTCSEMAKLNNAQPTDIFSAQFSIPFGVSLALIHGCNLISDYTLDALNRKDLMDLARKVRVIPDRSMDKFYPRIIGAKATIEINGLGEISEYVKFPNGEPENPMNQEALNKKFRSLASTLLTIGKIRSIEKILESLEEIKDIRCLARLLSSSSS